MNDHVNIMDNPAECVSDATVLASFRMHRLEIAREADISPDDNDRLRLHAHYKLKRYMRDVDSALNRTVSVHILRPGAADSACRMNGGPPRALRDWLSRLSFDWRYGDGPLKAALERWPSCGIRSFGNSKRTVELDGLIMVAGRKTAVKVASAGCLAEAAGELVMSVQSGKADCGVIIVPWSCIGKNWRGRIEMEGRSSAAMETISCLAIVRELDVYRSIV